MIWTKEEKLVTGCGCAATDTRYGIGGTRYKTKVVYGLKLAALQEGGGRLCTMQMTGRSMLRTATVNLEAARRIDGMVAVEKVIAAVVPVVDEVSSGPGSGGGGSGSSEG